MKMSMIKNLSIEFLEKATLVWIEVNQLTPLTDESFVYPSEEYKNRTHRIIDPTPEERREILSIFKQEGAIKVLHEYTYGRREVPYEWLIEVINPRFNELKSEIKELYESKAEESLKEAGITWDGQRWSQQDQGQKVVTQDKNSSKPTYRAPNILFQGKSIPITANTYQDSICSIAFKNKAAMTKEWSWDEIFEKRGELNPEKGWWRKIYMAGREINDKIAIQTGIKDLLIVKKRTIAVNPKYLK